VSVPDDTTKGGFANLGSLPVGCSSPNQNPAKVSKAGTIFAGPGITVGTVGPPAVGTDSNGAAAATDALDYPCPPTQAQVTAGVSCAFVYQDSKGETASLPISFTIPYSTVPTTPTTAPPAVGCTQVPSTVTTAGATVTVDPANCLVENETVTVSGSGFKASSESSILECNTDPSQPTVFDTLANQAIPVGCSNLLTYVSETGADGTVASKTFTIMTGTVGPPCATSCSGSEATDSSGGSTDADAAKYPCPPTAAQLAESPPVSCAIAVGDAAGDQVVVPIAFGSGPALPPPAGTKGAGATTDAAKAATTKASSGALAFTGAGPGLTALAAGGVVLIVFGLSLLCLVDGPRMLWATVRRSVTRPDRR
jgi:hypothetical protein